jgi:metallo-beta-lactamase class B
MFARVTFVLMLLASCAPSAAPQSATREQQAAWAAQCRDDSGWDDSGPPFRVFGSTYYVGTCGIASILITGDQGHVLIDSGTDKGADLVVANIRALGFEPRDVKALLMTHEHHDHVGGMARLQQLTGARLLTSPRATQAMTTGKASDDDPQVAIANALAPARVDGPVHDGVPVHLGALSLMPMATPGHTPGATTWFWRSCEGETCQAIVYADSLSPVSSDSYKFGDHPAYLADFRRSLARLAQLDCDVLITPHPSASGMRDRLLRGDLAGPAACEAYADSRTKMLDERLAEEAGE